MPDSASPLPAPAAASGSFRQTLARGLAFAALLALLIQGFRLFGFTYPDPPAPTRAGDRLYLSADDYFYDHIEYMYRDDGPIEAARRADLLFAGNSRLMFGIQYDAVVEALRDTGVRPHWFGFGLGEAWELPARLIREKDLAPPLVLINADEDFFSKGLTAYSKYLMRLGPKGAFDLAERRQRKNEQWRFMMRLFPVPQWVALHGELEFTRKRDMYRSETFGDWLLADPLVTEKATQTFHKPSAKPLPPDFETQAQNAIEMVQLIRSRGGEAIFIVVPNLDADETVAQALGKRLGVRVLAEKSWDGYQTFDASHLNPPSARRYTRSIMAQLKETPEWRALPARRNRANP